MGNSHKYKKHSGKIEAVVTYADVKMVHAVPETTVLSVFDIVRPCLQLQCVSYIYVNRTKAREGIPNVGDYMEIFELVAEYIAVWMQQNHPPLPRTTLVYVQHTQEIHRPPPGTSVLVFVLRHTALQTSTVWFVEPTNENPLKSTKQEKIEQLLSYFPGQHTIEAVIARLKDTRTANDGMERAEFLKMVPDPWRHDKANKSRYGYRRPPPPASKSAVVQQIHNAPPLPAPVQPISTLPPGHHNEEQVFHPRYNPPVPNNSRVVGFQHDDEPLLHQTVPNTSPMYLPAPLTGSNAYVPAPLRQQSFHPMVPNPPPMYMSAPPTVSNSSMVYVSAQPSFQPPRPGYMPPPMHPYPPYMPVHPQQHQPWPALSHQRDQPTSSGGVCVRASPENSQPTAPRPK